MTEHEHEDKLAVLQGTMHELICSCGEVNYIFVQEGSEPLVLRRQPAMWTVNGVDHVWPPKTEADAT